MTEQRELNGKAKPVGVQSPRFNEIEIAPRSCATNQVQMSLPAMPETL